MIWAEHTELLSMVQGPAMKDCCCVRIDWLPVRSTSYRVEGSDFRAAANNATLATACRPNKKS